MPTQIAATGLLRIRSHGIQTHEANLYCNVADFAPGAVYYGSSNLSDVRPGITDQYNTRTCVAGYINAVKGIMPTTYSFDDWTLYAIADETGTLVPIDADTIGVNGTVVTTANNLAIESTYSFRDVDGHRVYIRVFESPTAVPAYFTYGSVGTPNKYMIDQFRLLGANRDTGFTDGPPPAWFVTGRAGKALVPFIRLATIRNSKLEKAAR